MRYKWCLEVRFMNRTNSMILAAVMLFASLCAQFAAGADLCTSAVDPYDIVSEKARFYASAGKDNELSATEFAAIQIGPTGFRRKFDKWSEMLKFDRDGNKSLDWLEAGAYRFEMRKMVLAGYDANKDGKLGGPERQSACKALASGKIRFPVKRSAPPPPSPHRPKDHKKPNHKPPSGKPDKHHDTRSRESAQAADKEARLREARRRHEEHQARRDIEKFDSNKDGRLDKKENAERDKYNTESQKRQYEGKKRYSELLKKYDRNGDGRLDDGEKAAAKESYRQEAMKRAAAAREASKKKIEEYHRRKEVEKYDKNKDGRLDEEESAALNEARAEQKRRKEEFYRKYDSNRDGKISSEEKNVYLQELKKRKEDQDRDKRKGKKDKGKKDPSKRKPPKSPKKHSRKDR